MFHITVTHRMKYVSVPREHTASLSLHAMYSCSPEDKEKVIGRVLTLACPLASHNADKILKIYWRIRDAALWGPLT